MRRERRDVVAGALQALGYHRLQILGNLPKIKRKGDAWLGASPFRENCKGDERQKSVASYIDCQRENPFDLLTILHHSNLKCGNGAGILLCGNFAPKFKQEKGCICETVLFKVRLASEERKTKFSRRMR
jgi:hypothetical protein